ncbi:MULTISPECIES: urea ABC transporter ATP-binding protein UrtD [unclassified Agarivorans]|uniref:urea ABC transporter ATP-binding protein UrtD n=1 Tax=unclassified Agarivorans TaxID=2636026 RepID=UPI0010EA2044|nr:MULTISPECIES: urea ABC transporter ATP-binding protein UrtD [unclassified Agarivorans]MDO6687859.1 urea ABC transporter ATP-binding protein UrtD [Agarivorans sp. 3_MG-2023]MDO6717481.1 urea ABC transporter ATP-binding protein UrtD [Agarivorans sp. 2_MG-2023]MDO6763205.1 urea ABC transporter ATP-binding protein UrtD [Agarivorans sp. 1_MG-2023]GDY27010.1 ABC transporter ATP-binding protein [Agarivorans sp. Toyoura001]
MRSVHIPQDTILYVDGVTKSFDGFKALNSLSLILEPGQMRAIIGPNGAGKTTMMDVITGKLRPDEGTVFFNNDIDLTQHDEAEIANIGIGRKFQKPSVIENLSVFENLELALAGRRGVFESLIHKLSSNDNQQINDTLALIRLADKQDWLAGSLSHGQKQWLEIGMLIMQEPQLLLIDEPAAGMTDEETALTAELFKELAKKHSLVVVEHDMDFVKALDCPVTVLHEGSVLAQGTLEQVQQNQQVIEVYLGR